MPKKKNSPPNTRSEGAQIHSDPQETVLTTEDQSTEVRTSKKEPIMRARPRPVPFVAWRPTVENLIFDELTKGVPLTKIPFLHPGKCPELKTIFRKMDELPEFATKMQKAFNIFMMIKVDELDRIGRTPAVELFPEYKNKPTIAEATARRLQDVLKFEIKYVAPYLSDKFKPVSVNTSKALEAAKATSNTNISIVNYYGSTASSESLNTLDRPNIIDNDS